MWIVGRVTHTVLLEQAWQLYEEGKLLELVDPELNDFPEEEITRYIKVAFFCTQAVANRRPLMSQVIEMLSRNIRLNEKQLTAPGYFQESGSLSELPFSNKKSSESSTSYQMSSAPITVTQVTPRWKLESYIYIYPSFDRIDLIFLLSFFSWWKMEVDQLLYSPYSFSPRVNFFSSYFHLFWFRGWVGEGEGVITNPFNIVEVNWEIWINFVTAVALYMKKNCSEY